MPNQTYTLDREHFDLIQEREKNDPEVNNRSQALREILNDYMETTEAADG